jgi:hypothetical protein
MMMMMIVQIFAGSGKNLRRRGGGLPGLNLAPDLFSISIRRTRICLRDRNGAKKQREGREGDVHVVEK